ncbi:MAG: CPBP family intramembrane metalloprotease [Phycisphaerales bacterium]|nr:CPBP family intramembrane metalloprotease [Phycisphaerales bacterium]
MAHGPYDPDPTSKPLANPHEHRPVAEGRPQPERPLVPLMAQVFNGRSVADPGNPRRRRGFWIAAIALIALVTAMQQVNVIKVLLPGKAEPAKQAAGAEGTDKPKPIEPLGADLDQADNAGRQMVKLVHAVEGKEREKLARDMAQFVNPGDQPQIDNAVRIVPAYAELAGRENALKEIDRLRTQVAGTEDLSEEEKAVLSADLDALSRLYTVGSEALSAGDRERIEERLGWQGRLALTFDVPDTDPQRAEMVANGIPLVLFLALVGLGLVLLVPVGLGMCIWASVLIGTGRLRPRMDRPLAGGSIGIEVVVVFLAGFAGLRLLMELVALAADQGWLGAALKSAPDGTLVPITLVLQWLILPMVVFYPRLRAYPRWRVNRALGWHRGEGFIREMAAGVAGYLASLPLYVVGAALALLLGMLEHFIIRQITGTDPPGPVNPIAGLLAESWWIALLVAALATVWAPIVEELVFRGAMFRQLYARMGVIAAALLSGTVFAMMHGYSPSLFPPLIVLGTCFAVIRWWRGSLVATVTAHALHNGTLMIIMLVLFSLLK